MAWSGAISGVPRKPHWLPQDTWRDLLAKYGGIPECAACGSGCAVPVDELTIDHIVPKRQGGGDELSNLQFMCARENDKKGPRRDAYWRKSFFWDGAIDLSKLRMAQRTEAFERILLFREWFSRPWSEIARRLYTLAWVIGSGKTLAVPVLAFALNHVVRSDRNEAAPRNDHILVLCKEIGIRDQFAEELSDDLVKHGICQVKPRVGVLKEGHLLDSELVLDQADVWVGCLHLLFEKNGQARNDLAAVLARFPTIFFDEPHYATEQVLKIVEAAATSLCFGLTATPIDAAGDALRRFVLFSQYGYDQAVEFDQSLKFVSERSEYRREVFVELGITEAEVQQGVGTRVIHRTDEVQSYDYQLAPAKSVVERVLYELQEYDRIAGWSTELARHRPASFSATLPYPAHALIRCETRRMGEMLVRTVNDRFAEQRSTFPERLGYRAELIVSEGPNADGIPTGGTRLTRNHPWLAAAQNGYQLTQQSARVLVTVDMAREGMNNPLCVVVGEAGRIANTREAVQRSIGRPSRSVRDRDRVPPRELDTIKTVTHVAFGNRDIYHAGLVFVCDMASHLEHMPTMDDLLNERAPVPVGGQLPAPDGLSIRDRVRLAAALGAAREGLSPTAEEDLQRCILEIGGGSPVRQERVKAWLELLEEQPAEAWRALQHPALRQELTPVPIVVRETPEHLPNREELVRYLRSHHPELLGNVRLLDDPTTGPLLQEAYETLYADHAQRFYLPDVPSVTNLDGIRKTLAGTMTDTLGHHLVKGTGGVHKFVGSAVKQILGVPASQSASLRGPYDTPQCHAILTRPEIERKILAWVRVKLIESGECPALAAAFGLGGVAPAGAGYAQSVSP